MYIARAAATTGDGLTFQFSWKILEAIPFKLHIIHICACKNLLAAMVVNLGQVHTVAEVVKILPCPC